MALNSIILILLSSFVVIVFLLLIYNFIRYRREDMEYPLVCAGTEYLDDTNPINLKKESIKKSIYSHTFLDKSRKPLEVDRYCPFIVKGWSMMLAGILNGDLILTEKKFNPYDIVEKKILPNIYVIQREEESIQNIRFKLRRGWCVVRGISKSVDNEKEYFRSILNAILTSELFDDLRVKAKEAMVNMPSNEELINDFFDERLARYKNHYLSSSKKYPSEYDAILISTTLHTDENVIKFSIHPISNIVGKMEYCYRMSEQSEHVA